MKINFVVPFLSLTGGLKIIFEYATRIKKKGNEVKIYVPYKPYKVYYKENKTVWLKQYIKNIINGNNIQWADFDLEIIPIPSIKERYIDDGDIIIATAWPTAYDVNNLSENKGKKVYFIQDYEIWHGDIEKVEQTYKFDMEQIVIAQWLKELVEKKNGNKKAHLIYNGIDLNEMYNNDKNYNLNSKNVVMLYHNLPSKGTNDGIEIINKIRKEDNSINLIMFGAEKGDNIPDYAEFYLLPERREIREIYSRGDVFLFTSISEGWGLTPLEAMACKCAVVGRDVGAIKEIGDNNKNVLKSNVEDVDSLEKNLIKVLNDINLRKTLSEEGYKLIKQFDWSKSVEKFYNVLEGTLDQE